MFIYLNKRGQSTLEYGIVIAVIVAALIAMQIYFKRGVQGKLKQSSDDIGSQFSPGESTGTTNSFSSANSFENMTPGVLNGAEERSVTASNTFQTQNRYENLETGNAEWMP